MLKPFHDPVQGPLTFGNLYAEMVQRFPNGSRFVEVGSWLGRSARFMAHEIASCRKKIEFFCVDPWDIIIGNLPNTYGGDPFLLFLKTLDDDNLRHYVTPMVTTSLKAAEHFGPNSLEFVFIDAMHDFQSVSRDIEAWIERIKPGGVIAGHDYTLNMETRRAVDAYFNNPLFALDRRPIRVDGECWVVEV